MEDVFDSPRLLTTHGSTAQVWTGRVAAAIKEIVCRSTVFAIRGEGRLRIPFYRWPRPSAATTPLPQPAAVGD